MIGVLFLGLNLVAMRPDFSAFYIALYPCDGQLKLISSPAFKSIILQNCSVQSSRSAGVLAKNSYVLYGVNTMNLY